MKHTLTALMLTLCLAAGLAFGAPALAADGDFIIEDGLLTEYLGTGGTIVIPDGVTAIQYSTFNFLHSSRFIYEVTFPDSVTSIGNYAFYSNYMTDLVLPDSVTTIETQAFAQCFRLTSVTLSEGLTTMWDGVFQRCSSLVEVSIPKSLTAIPAATFANCESLARIYIPDSVTEISHTAFEDCPNLTIYGALSSAAEQYAKEHGIPFVVSAPDLGWASGWARENINEAYAAGLIPSELQTSYTQTTTRAEFCALAVALYETVRGEITERSYFNDTADTDVQKAAAIGVVNGANTELGLFSPNDPLTREQAATMLSRLAEAMGHPLPKQSPLIENNGIISIWAIEAVGQMQASGIMRGVGENTFAPQGDYARRAEHYHYAASIQYRDPR